MTEPEPRSEEGIEAIDMSVAFFAAVLMLFVFVAFNVQRPERPEELPSIGQTQPTVEAVPGTWSAIVPSGGFALLLGDTLHVIDMNRLAEGVANPLSQVSTDGGWSNFETLETAAPNSFALEVVFLAQDLEPALLRSVHDLASDANQTCPDTDVIGTNLAVVVEPDHPDLMPLLRFGFDCGLQIRVEPVDIRSRRTLRWNIARSPASYTSEAMFR